MAWKAFSENAKHALTHFVQKYNKITLKRGDIEYSNFENDGNYQSTVTLHCMGGVQMLGEFCVTEKEAENSAAEMALDAYQQEVIEVAALPKKEKVPEAEAASFGQAKEPRRGQRGGVAQREKRQALAEKFALAGGDPRAVKPRAVAPRAVGPPADDGRTQALAEACLSCIRRPLRNNDVTYEVTELGSGVFQAVVTLTCVGNRQFAGEAASTPQGAQQNAAHQALLARERWDPAFAANRNIGLVPASPHQPPPPAHAPPPQAWMQAGLGSGHVPSSRAAKSNTSPKYDLTRVLQSQLGRALTKQDVEYDVYDQGDGTFASTVTLHCLEGRVFHAAEVGVDEKDAANKAAVAALAELAPGGVAPAPAPGAGARAQAAQAAQARQAYQAAPAPAPARVRPPKRQLEQPPVPPRQEGQQTYWVPNPNEHPKLQLTQFLQAYIGRPLTKADVVYNTQAQSDGTFFSNVTLVCLEGRSFDGEFAISDKEAEKSAASAALAAHPGEIASLELAPPKRSRKEEPGAPAPVAVAPQPVPRQPPAVRVAPALPARVLPADMRRYPGEDPNDNPKSQLTKFMQALVKATLTKEAISYESESLDDGTCVSTVMLHCYENRSFCGQPCADQKAAEKSAAEAAFAGLEPELNIVAAQGIKSQKEKQVEKHQGAQAEAAAAGVALPPAAPATRPPRHRAARAAPGQPPPPAYPRRAHGLRPMHANQPPPPGHAPPHMVHQALPGNPLPPMHAPPPGHGQYLW